MKLNLSEIPYKFRHFYWNKYVLKLFRKERFFMSYSYRYKAIWFRNYKVASRTINNYLTSDSKPGSLIYGSAMPYSRWAVRNFYKFSFVRNPEEKFISCWKDKVTVQNYFRFSEEEHRRMQDFDTFLTWVEGQDVTKCDEHLRAQTSIIDIPNMDFVGRFENFDEDFAKVAEQLGTPYEKEVRLNVNRSTKKVELSDNQRRRLQRIYRKDYEVFYPELLID